MIAKASLEYVPGDFFIEDGTTGRAEQALAANNNIGSGVRLAGFATTNTDTPLAVDTEFGAVKLEPGAYFNLCLCNGDAAAAWSDAYRGDKYPLRRTTSGVYALNVGTTSNANFRIVELVEDTRNDATPIVVAQYIGDQ